MHIEIVVPTLDFMPFDNSKHPRNHGKFASKGGVPTRSPAPKVKQSPTPNKHPWGTPAARQPRQKKLTVSSVKKLGAAYGGTMRHQFGAKQHLAMIAEAVARKHGAEHGAAFHQAALVAHARSRAVGRTHGAGGLHRAAAATIRNVVSKGTLDALGVSA